jgi:hypothetical protein
MISRALQHVKRSLDRPARGALSRQAPGVPETRRQADHGPWVSFRYSFRSVVAQGDQAHVVVRERRMRDGRLEAEDFEGTVEGHWATEVLEAMRRAVEDRARALLASFAGRFLPSRRPPDYE